MGCVLVCLVCHKIKQNKTPQAGWLKQQHFIFSVLEAGSPKSMCLQGWFLVRLLFRACRHCLLAVPSRNFFQCVRGERERERGISGVSSLSYKDTSPTGLGPYPLASFILNYFPKGLTPNIATLGVRDSTYEFGGTQFSPQ